MRARRDPEGRKRAIVEAAADLIAESGIVGLTHRKIAARAQVPLGSTTHYFASLDDLKVEALEHIANVLDDGLQVVAHELAESSDWQRTLAQVFYGYLSDPARVRSDVAFYVVGTGNPARARWPRAGSTAWCPYWQITSNLRSLVPSLYTAMVRWSTPWFMAHLPAKTLSPTSSAVSWAQALDAGLNSAGEGAQRNTSLQRQDAVAESSSLLVPGEVERGTGNPIGRQAHKPFDKCG